MRLASEVNDPLGPFQDGQHQEHSKIICFPRVEPLARYLRHLLGERTPSPLVFRKEPKTNMDTMHTLNIV